MDELCSFFIDGRLVKVENNVPLMVALRPRVGIAEAISKLVQVERNREPLSMGGTCGFHMPPEVSW